MKTIEIATNAIELENALEDEIKEYIKCTDKKEKKKMLTLIKVTIGLIEEAENNKEE
jgi:hypothetical protein